VVPDCAPNIVVAAAEEIVSPACAKMLAGFIEVIEFPPLEASSITLAESV
jgi:hypothetical protein